MAGVKISELIPTFALNDDDTLVLARPGAGNGSTYKIYGSVFGKASDVLALQNRATALESRATNLETRATNLETNLETGVDGLETGKVSKSGDTMTGFLILHDDPQTDLGAATRRYVDDKVAGGIGSLGKTWADFKCTP